MNTIEPDSINESLRQQFEMAWIDGQPLDIESCLPSRDDPQFVPTLEELVHIEMEFGWAKAAPHESQQRKIEFYLDRFGELDSEEIVLRLIEQEIRCRKKQHDSPTIGEYQQRFPTLCDQLGLLDTIDQSSDSSNDARSAVNARPGEQVGRYIINDRQGEGGFGLVWQADDPKLGRRIAIKQLNRRLASSEEQRRRFISEARIAAKLEHPGVVPVYDLEQQHDGDPPYYTMKLVSGSTLDEAIRQYHAEFKQSKTGNVERLKLLNIFLAICRTMQYAHDHGVIHRDLKPQNFIVGDYGETIILDWGLAKSIGSPDPIADASEDHPETNWLDREDLTQAGAVMGTPAYMSPEQADGRIRDIDERSDVYSLGVILFQMITGEFPFAAKTTGELIKKVVEGKPRPPRTLDHAIPRALQSICLKAMNRNLRQRYQSVAALSQDMEKFLADDPVSCHAETIPERIGRWTRKNRRWVAAGVAAISLITISSIVAAIMINEQRKIAIANEHAANWAKGEETAAKVAAQKSELAEKKAKIAERQQRQLAQWQLARSHVKDGQRNLEDIDVHTALLWYVKALKLEHENPRQNNVHRRRLNALLRRVPKLVNLFFNDSGDELIDAHYSTDQSKVLVIGKQKLVIRKIETGAIEKTIEYGFTARTAKLSADQTRLLVANQLPTKPEVKLFDVENAKPLWTKSIQNDEGEPKFTSLTRLEISPDNSRCAVVCDGGQLSYSHNLIVLFNADAGQNLAGQIQQGSRISDLNFSPDGKHLINACWDNSASVWNAGDGKLVKKFDLNTLKIENDPTKPQSLVADFSPDGKTIITSSSHRCFFWNSETYEPTGEVAHGSSFQEPDIKFAVFSEKSKYLATVDWVFRVRIWDVESGEFISEYKNHEGSINHIEFFGESRVLTTSLDGTARYWDPSTGELVNGIYHHGDSVTKGRVDKSGYKILTASRDQSVRLWDATQTQIGSSSKPIRPGQVLVQNFAHCERYYATYSRLGNKFALDLWDSNTFERIGESIPLEDSVVGLEFDPAGNKLLVNCSANFRKRETHFVQIYDASTAKPLTDKMKHTAYISSAGFSPDGNFLFTASHDKTLAWWDLKTSQPLHKRTLDTGINVAVVSHDGKFLVTGSWDKSARLWSTETLEPIGEKISHKQPVTSISIHPDNDDILLSGYQQLTSGQAEGEAMIFRRSTGKLRESRFENNSYFGARYRRDGKYFLTYGNGNQVVVYQSDSGKKLGTVNHRSSVLSANFHPTLPRFVTSSSDKVVRVWEIETGKPVSPVMQMIGIPAEAIFSPDGSVVVTRNAMDRFVRTWDSQTAAAITLDINYSQFPNPIAFTESGNRLFVGGTRPLFWNFEKYPGSIEDASQLVELLAAQRIDEVGGLVPLSTAELQSRWESIQSKR